jgi:hypothetical protein
MQRLSIDQKSMFRKVIVSHLGELTHDTRTVGDKIRYRIYYAGSFKSDIVIADRLDKSLSNVTAFNDGQYDPNTHTVTWRLKALAAKRGGFVDFEALISKAGLIRNQALVSGLGMPRQSTNPVETQVCSPPALGLIACTPAGKQRTRPKVFMKDETTLGTTLRFDLPGLYVYEEKIDQGTYHHVSLAGGGSNLRQVGKPELPIVVQAIEVPFGVEFTPQIIIQETVTLDNYTVYPAQRPEHDPKAPPHPLDLDRACYTTDAEYPKALVEAGDEVCAVVRGHRLLFLQVNPVRYNPATKKLTVCTLLEVRLNYNKPAQITGIEKRLRSEAFEQLLQRTILNYKDPGRFVAPDTGLRDAPGCDYLIIIASKLYSEDPKSALMQLVHWKRCKGYTIGVKKVDEIGKDPTLIRSFIQDAYDHWDPVPSYVLLVGDSDEVPPSPGMDVPPSLGGGPKINTDLYYGTVDGQDYFPDIFVGRLSAENEAELKAIVDKILDYEKNPPVDPDYYQDVSLLTQFHNSEPPGDPRQEGFPWVSSMETLRNFLSDSMHYNVERIYTTTSGYPIDGTQPKYFSDGTLFSADLQAYTWLSFADSGQPLKDALNDGRFLVNYLAHGDSNGFVSFPFRQEPPQPPGTPRWTHIDELKEMGVDPYTGQPTGPNGLPVIFAFTCSTCSFDNEIYDTSASSYDCLGEHFLRRAKAGAVAYVGFTRDSGLYDISDLMLGFNKAIWPEFTPTPHWDPGEKGVFPTAEQPRLLRLGQIVTYGKAWYANTSFKDNGMIKEHFEMMHLLGDPEMPIWTQMPQTLGVDHPDEMCADGKQEFLVRVTDAAKAPVLGAMVVITREDQILQEGQTNSAGQARFAFDPVGPGDIELTVTALDYRPYLGQIKVLSGSAALGLDPADGAAAVTTVQATGQGFVAGEPVTLEFDGMALPSSPLTAPLFASFLVPQHELGFVNVMAKGENSKKVAWAVFHVRPVIGVDLWTYDQHNKDTWPDAEDGPTWNSPDIDLYDKNGNWTPSDALQLNETYTVKVKVHNNTDIAAKAVKVTMYWENFGAGGPWQLFDKQPDPIDQIDKGAPGAPGTGIALAEFTPSQTGHLCIKAVIEHAEDISSDNNEGQENLSVGPASSPADFGFWVWNPTHQDAAVHLEVRQLIPPGQQKEARLWGSTIIKHPDPQILKPGESGEAWVSVDPDKDSPSGAQAEFAATAFIAGEIIGGVNVRVTKQ